MTATGAALELGIASAVEVVVVVDSRIGSLMTGVVPAGVHFRSAVRAVGKSRKGLYHTCAVLLALTDRGFHLTVLVPQLLADNGFVGVIHLRVPFHGFLVLVG